MIRFALKFDSEMFYDSGPGEENMRVAVIMHLLGCLRNNIIACAYCNKKLVSTPVSFHCLLLAINFDSLNPKP